MPAVEVANLKQWAVVWPAQGAADAYGQYRVGSYREVKVRWDDVNHVVLDAKSNTVAADVKVVLAEDVPIGSIMWQGRLADWTHDRIADLRYVIRFNKKPDIKGRQFRREASLMRFKDKLPTNFQEPA